MSDVIEQQNIKNLDIRFNNQSKSYINFRKNRFNTLLDNSIIKDSQILE